MPERLRGRSFVLVEAACLATQGEGVELLRALRDHEPEIDTFAMLTPTALGDLHMDPVGPVPAFIDGWLLADLPPAAIDTFVRVPRATAPGRHCSRSSCDTWEPGCPRQRPSTARLASLEAGFATATYSVVPDTDSALAVGRHAATLRAALAPWEAERNYPNFAERSFDLARIFSPADRERLERVKAQYDPGGHDPGGHPVPVA